MNTNTMIALGVVACLLVAGGVAAFLLLGNNDKDPDYYENPYYTLSYSISTEEKTLTDVYGDQVVTGPTGLYSYSYIYSGTNYIASGGNLGSTGSFIWWDVQIEIYGKPNELYLYPIYFAHQREPPNTLEGVQGFIRVWNLGYNNMIGPSYTDDKGRLTLTFSLGVFSDEIFGAVDLPGLGAPKSVTFIT